MGVRVRWGRVEDAQALAAVHVRAWQEGYAGLLPQDLLDGLRPQDRLPRWTSTLSAADPPRSGTLVAEGELPGGVGTMVEGLVGFLQLGPARDPVEPAGSSGAAAPDESVGEVMSCYVDPAAWRHGVGRALMTAALEALAEAGHDRASLWVLEGNDRAIAFYRRTGWVLDGTRKGDVVGGRDIADLGMRHGLARRREDRRP